MGLQGRSTSRHVVLGGEGFAEYRVDLRRDGLSWHVWARFRQFEALQRALREQLAPLEDAKSVGVTLDRHSWSDLAPHAPDHPLVVALEKLDGAAATLLMSEEKALELGFKPKAYLREWTFVSCDPFDEMLLGPAYATAKVLGMAGMKLSDLDVIEFHEAFAGQVLSNVAALNSQKFFDEKLDRCGYSKKYHEIIRLGDGKLLEVERHRLAAE